MAPGHLLAPGPCPLISVRVYQVLPTHSWAHWIGACGGLSWKWQEASQLHWREGWGGQTQWDTGIWWAEVKVWKGEGGRSFQLRRRPGQASAAESMKSGQEIGCQWERGLWSLSTDTRTSAVLSHVPLQTPAGAPTESLQNVQGRVGWGRHGHPGGGSVAARSAWQKESLPKRPHRLTCKFHRSYAEPAVLGVWPWGQELAGGPRLGLHPRLPG